MSKRYTYTETEVNNPGFSRTTLILIAAALLFGFHLGMWFTIAVIFLACGYILYDTSVMMRYAEPDDDIICTINLFTSVMTLFFYILRLLMELNRN